MKYIFYGIIWLFFQIGSLIWSFKFADYSLNEYIDDVENGDDDDPLIY